MSVNLVEEDLFLAKTKVKLHQMTWPRQSWCQAVNWAEAPPFCVNSLAQLVHRTYEVARMLSVDGTKRHLYVGYLCGNCCTGYPGHKITLTDDPPENRLVCQRCEQKAKELGLPSADDLAGRHVHVGRLMTVRICCQDRASN